MHTDPQDELKISAGWKPAHRRKDVQIAAMLGSVLSMGMMPAPGMTHHPSHAKKKPSKNRDKVKAARKQNRKRRAGK